MVSSADESKSSLVLGVGGEGRIVALTRAKSEREKLKYQVDTLPIPKEGLIRG